MTGARGRRRALLIGEDFGHAHDRYLSDRYALTGQSGERLASLAGLEFPGGYVRLFDRSNVVERPDDWRDPAKVATGVERLTARMLDESRVILLGRRVAAAFDVVDLDMLEWRLWRVRVHGAMVTPGTQIARLPHPSGRNRWWNDQANTQRAQTFMRDTTECLRN